MTDKPTLLKTFNTQFFSFLDDIISIYPENRELLKGKKSFELIKMANPSIIVKVWFTHVYSLYSNEINNGDVDFFFTKDYQSDLVDVPNSKEVLRIIEMIKEPISKMEDVNKQNEAIIQEMQRELGDDRIKYCEKI